jgi:hypothetical protein
MGRKPNADGPFGGHMKESGQVGNGGRVKDHKQVQVSVAQALEQRLPPVQVKSFAQFVYCVHIRTPISALLEPLAALEDLRDLGFIL